MVMTSARVTRSGEDHPIHERQLRMEVAGKVRPGIQRLTQAAAKNKAIVEIYNRGVKAGASFSQIEQVILSKVPKAPKRPMTPDNVPYFRVHQDDFAVPGAAAAIIEEHGEIRDGDEEKRLYSFPVVFAGATIDEVFQETFESWKYSELFRWSEKGPDGVLKCMKMKDGDEKSKRKKWTPRAVEAIGNCEPDECDLFDQGNCKHIGTLFFLIPGVKGSGLISMTFPSKNAARGIVTTLNSVFGGLGRIRGMYNGVPIFRISKVYREVSFMNWETGKKMKTKKHIICLSADGIDMCELFAAESLPAPQPPVAQITHQEQQPQEQHQPDDTPAAAEDDGVVAEQAGDALEIVSEAPAVSQEAKEDLDLCKKALNFDDEAFAEWMNEKGYAKKDAEDPEIVGEMIELLMDLIKEHAPEIDEEKTAPAADLDEQDEIPF